MDLGNTSDQTIIRQYVCTASVDYVWSDS